MNLGRAFGTGSDLDSGIPNKISTTASSSKLESDGNKKATATTDGDQSSSAKKKSNSGGKGGFLASSGFDGSLDEAGLSPPATGSAPWKDTSLTFPSAGSAIEYNFGRKVSPPISRRPPPRRRSPPISPSQVAMEEFAALESKLAGGGGGREKKALTESTTSAGDGKVKKTPQQVAVDEFAALERKLSGSAAEGARSTNEADGKQQKRRSVKVLTKPKEPEGSECCGTGCANCVWIDYWEELQQWEEAEQERELAEPP